MNGELRRLLEPQRQKVESAQADLDASNRSDVTPLDALMYAGRVIHEQQALIDALWDLLDRRDPDEAECLHEQTLGIQGRLRRLAELREEKNARIVAQNGY